MQNINRVTTIEYELMTEDQKRIYLIQIWQEETMKWQRHAAKVQVYIFWFGIVFLFFWITLRVIRH